MILYIDTTDLQSLKLGLKSSDFATQETIKTDYNQAEKLLPAIAKLLKKHKYQLKDITKIIVANGHGSFTSLRIGIATANALAYTLQVPVEDDSGQSISLENITLVEPRYEQEPNISQPQKK